MASSDDEASPSPAMQFARSVPRRAGRRALAASPSDSENSPVVAAPPQAAAVKPAWQSAASGYVLQRQQHQQQGLILGTPSSSSKGGSSPHQLARSTPQQPLRPQSQQPLAAAGCSSAFQTPSQPRARSRDPPLSDSARGSSSAHGRSSSPFTPAAGRLQPPCLDLQDPYTPWLRTTTARKPRQGGVAAGRGRQPNQQHVSHGDGSSGISSGSADRTPAVAAAAGGECQDTWHALSDSPVSTITSASSRSSSLDGRGAAEAAAAPAEASKPAEAVGLSSLCAAVADLQLAQSLAQQQTHSAADASGDGCAAAVDTTPPAATAPHPQAAAGIAGSTSSSDDDDDEAAPLTLGRRTQPRVYRRPMFAVSDSDSDSSSSESSSSESSGCSKATGPCGPHSCGGAHRRVTPGSTSSLVARRRTNPSSSSRRRHNHPAGDNSNTTTATGYTDAYDIDVHLSTIKPPRWQLLLEQQQQQQLRSPFSVSPISPVAALSFATPGGGSGAATRQRPLPAAAAATPSAGFGVGGADAARRLSQCFLQSGGGGGGLPLTPPVLKGQQGQQQQQQTLYSTPAAAAAAAGARAGAGAGAGGRQGAQTALPARKTAAGGRAAAGADSEQDTSCTLAPQQGFGKLLWTPPPPAATGGGGLKKQQQQQQPGAGAGDTPFVPSSRRRGANNNTNKAAGAAAAAAAGCATAPAKAPSSRMWARTRQALAQQLYDQWNALVFDSALPPDLPLVWNPRLTATAGQVVDDGSRNAVKDCREQRIPVRLELSSKVLDCEARLRTTLSHEMCHVAAWVISKEWREHHGAVFWAWARRFEKAVPGIKITTCHNFDVHAPFRWQCSNHSCGKLYVRHKRSIDTVRHVCSRCQGRLLYLGKFSRDGKLIGSSVSDAAAAGAAGAAGGAAATPGGGGGNAFTMFVKHHFADLKRSLPTGTPHKEVMTRLAAQYKEQKQRVAAAAALTPAAPATGTPAAAGAAGTTPTATPAAATAATPAATTRTMVVAAAAVASSSISTSTAAVTTTTITTARRVVGVAVVTQRPATEQLLPAAGVPPPVADGGDASTAISICSSSSSEDDDDGGGSDDEGWQTAEEEVEEQTSSLLSFMDRLALS